MPTQTSSADPLISALASALAGPKILISKGGQSPVEGIFPSGAKGKELAERAIKEGYLTKREESVRAGRSTSKVVLGVITEKGLQAFVKENSPKDALTALLPAVQQLGKAAPAPDTVQIVSAIESSTAACVSAINAAFAALRADVMRSVAPTGRDSIDPDSVLAALTTALEKVKPIVANTEPVKPPEPEPKLTLPDSATALADEIVSFVNATTTERTVGCDFVELFDHLKAKHPSLTVGGFHDALRTLDEAGRIRLKDWPRMQDEIPRPELALFVSHTVMYHVQPAR